MSDERFDFRSMTELSQGELRDALASSCPRTVRRAEREISRRHKIDLRRRVAQDRARVIFWLIRHSESIVLITILLVIAFAIAFTALMFV